MAEMDMKKMFELVDTELLEKRILELEAKIKKFEDEDKCKICRYTRNRIVEHEITDNPDHGYYGGIGAGPGYFSDHIWKNKHK